MAFTFSKEVNGNQADNWPMKLPFSDGRSSHHRLPAGRTAVSARKLAASLWQLTNCGGEDVGWKRGNLGFEFCSAPSVAKCSLEGITKWDYDVGLFHHERDRNTLTIKPITYDDLWQQKRLIQHCTTNLHEEGVSRTMKRLNDDVRIGKKMYSKLMREIGETKASTKKLMHCYERERKSRELLEDFCIEQGKELEAMRGEVQQVRIQCSRMEREMTEERQMLQMAEGWREERVQMKMLDAKWMLDDKYSQMSCLIADLNHFLKSFNFNKDIDRRTTDDSVQLQQVVNIVPKSDYKDNINVLDDN